MKNNHDIIKKGRSHDAGYKSLLASPDVVRDLITHFVAADFVKDIDFDTLEPYRENFVAKARLRRTTDVVWSARLRGKGPAYFFILLEPQATVDRWMALRVLIYTLLLYQDLLVKKKVRREEKLPPVLPMVIYRGARRWKAPLNIRELIDTSIGELKGYVPDFSYLLIEAEHPKEVLTAMKSIMAKIFLLETSSLDDLEDAFAAFKVLYDDLEPGALKETLKHWCEGRMEIMGLEAPDLDEKEARMTFEAKVRDYKTKIRKELKRERADVEQRLREEKAEVERRAREEKDEIERRAREEKRAMARAMKEKGIDPAVIAEITGLSAEELSG